MTSSTSAGLVAPTSRLTVVSATRRVDLAVPTHLPVAELLAVVVSSLGPAAAEVGAGEGGWLLQRAGEAPLDPAARLADAGVVDGDVLHLRTGATALPAATVGDAVTDDVLEVVAEAVRAGTSRWTSAGTAHAALAAAVAVLTGAAGLALTSGSPAVPGVLGGAAAVLVLIAIAERLRRRRPVSVAAALTAVGYAVTAGTAAAPDHPFGPTAALLGCGSALLTASTLLAARVEGVAGLVGVAMLAGLGGAGAGTARLAGLPAAGAAAVVIAAAATLGPVIPWLALAVARVPRPGTDGDPPATDLARARARAGHADRCLTGLVGGAAIAQAGAGVTLAVCGGVTGVALAAVSGAVCLLRARGYGGTGQRALLLAGGTVALLTAGIVAATALAGAVRLAVVTGPVVLAGVALLVLAPHLAGARRHAAAARVADLAEVVLGLAVLPVALAVVGAYGAIGGLVS